MAKTNFRKEYPFLQKNVNGVDIDLTDAEYEATIIQWEANEAEAVVREAEDKATANAKAVLLARLGITADEAKLLLA